MKFTEPPETVNEILLAPPKVEADPRGLLDPIF